MKNEVKLFEQQKVRTHWDEKEEKWYFSIIDVIAILTDSVNPRDYWFKMKVRVKTEDGLELSTVCRQLKMKAADGKMRETDVAERHKLKCRNWKDCERCEAGTGTKNRKKSNHRRKLLTAIEATKTNRK